MDFCFPYERRPDLEQIIPAKSPNRGSFSICEVTFYTRLESHVLFFHLRCWIFGFVLSIWDVRVGFFDFGFSIFDLRFSISIFDVRFAICDVSMFEFRCRYLLGTFRISFEYLWRSKGAECTTRQVRGPRPGRSRVQREVGGL